MAGNAAGWQFAEFAKRVSSALRTNWDYPLKKERHTNQTPRIWVGEWGRIRHRLFQVEVTQRGSSISHQSEPGFDDLQSKIHPTFSNLVLARGSGQRRKNRGATWSFNRSVPPALYGTCDEERGRKVLGDDA